jgi:DNA-directed RNA polymerase specialized sigma24 family protein
MSQLPVDQQQVLAKVYMEGKSHQQASIDLGFLLALAWNSLLKPPN